MSTAVVPFDLADARERIRAALRIEEVVGWCGVDLKRSGHERWVACCPFHAEKSPSFVVGGAGANRERAHCFGCGWSGDVFAFWQQSKGCDHRQAVEQLAGMAGIPLGGKVFDAPRRTAVVKRAEVEGEVKFVKPDLPKLRALTEAECARIAEARGLPVEAVLRAAEDRFIGFARWPQWQDRHGAWHEREEGCEDCWLITDRSRNVAEYRRIDGSKFALSDGREIKAWSTRGKNWPVGCSAMGDRMKVLMVEGGPDFLAAVAFLLRWGVFYEVAVVSMLGTSNRIRESALGFFKGRRVRIAMDADEVKPDGKRPGLEAAARWTEQLTAAGAVVQAVDLSGVEMPDGAMAKDLNDLWRCDPGVRDVDEFRAVFRAWDF